MGTVLETHRGFTVKLLKWCIHWINRIIHFLSFDDWLLLSHFWWPFSPVPLSLSTMPVCLLRTTAGTHLRKMWRCVTWSSRISCFYCCSFVSDFCSSLSSSTGLPTAVVNLPKTDTRLMVFLALRKKGQYCSNPAEVITAKGKENV